MSDRLKGKRAVVTAAAAGIGRACAIAFAREGATVIATDINEKGIATLAQEGVAETKRLDVRNTADVDAFAKHVGKIDILLNAAGFVHHGTILDCSEEDWDFSFDLNVKSIHRTIKANLPAMLSGGGGSIVNISSCAGVCGSAEQPLSLQCVEGRGFAAHARDRTRFHYPGHSLQQHLSRHGGNAVDAVARSSGWPRWTRKVRRPPENGPAGYRGGNR